MADKKQKDDISKLTFEAAIKELTGIVEQIEQGEISLESSLGQYERGMALIKHCRTILQKAEKRIEKTSKEQEPEACPERSRRDRSQKTENRTQKAENA